MTGRVAMFNMWNRELGLAEIQSFGCMTEGNVLTMGDLFIVGDAEFSTTLFDCALWGK